MAITIAYDRSVKGWTSKFSFVPDAGISLNNNFYTFHRGRIWRHNVDEDNSPAQRNTFYGESTSTQLIFIFNEAPSSIKTFKTINYEGEGEWDVELSTDQDDVGEIKAEWFKTKEGKHFAWIRGIDNELLDLVPDYDTSAIGGVAVADSISGETFDELDRLLTSDINFNQPIPSTLAEGDALYRSEIVNGELRDPGLIGIVSAINGDSLTYSTGTGNSTLELQLPIAGDFILYSKNKQIEKSGLVGFYTTVTMSNLSPEYTELFAVSSEVQGHSG